MQEYGGFLACVTQRVAAYSTRGGRSAVPTVGRERSDISGHGIRPRRSGGGGLAQVGLNADPPPLAREWSDLATTMGPDTD